MRAALERDRAVEPRRLDRDARRRGEHGLARSAPGRAARRLARDRRRAAAVPAAPAGRRRRRCGAAAAAPAAAAAACCCCCALSCASCRCFSICGMPTKYCQAISTIADSTMARMVFFWSVIEALLRSPVRGSGAPRSVRGAACTRRSARSNSSISRSNGSVKRGAPADQHIVVSRPHARPAATAARSPAAAAARGCARPRCRPSSTR